MRDQDVRVFWDIALVVMTLQHGTVTYCPKKAEVVPGPGEYDTRTRIGRGRLSKTTFGESMRERPSSVRGSSATERWWCEH